MVAIANLAVKSGDKAVLEMSADSFDRKLAKALERDAYSCRSQPQAGL
jgi:hypothetical protein